MRPQMHVAEPWERRCGVCDGSGQVMSLAWAAWHQEYERLESIPDLPNRLRALAEHVRRVPAEVEVLTCPGCGGDGVVVTDQGAALLNFIERRLRRAPHWADHPPEPPERPPMQAPPNSPDDADSYFERPQPSPSNTPPSGQPAQVPTPEPTYWQVEDALVDRDLSRQRSASYQTENEDPWRGRMRPEWRPEDFD
jgi:Tryptophan RNA-binding attenuator protein inhibitory protein